jgi:hypothetical protein
MGRVSIRAQWLIVATGVVLCPVFAFLAACLIGWSLFRRLGPVRRQGPGVTRLAQHDGLAGVRTTG